MVFQLNGTALNFGTDSVSWWQSNGFGCRPVYDVSSEDPIGSLRPVLPVPGCFLNYEYVEVLHAAVQITFAVGFNLCYLFFYCHNSKFGNLLMTP